jgi:hypothetical protein
MQSFDKLCVSLVRLLNIHFEMRTNNYEYKDCMLR